jgi:hypothetical protein
MQQNMRPITKPDLNTIFESMLAIPADVRAQHVNAYLLTGTPEQKLAAAMIKDMPQSPAPSAPVQAPTQTVIEQKAAQVDPGIASLPVAEGMFDGGSYAGGGIIAFDDGGDVPGYATQGEVKAASPVGRWWEGRQAVGDEYLLAEKLRADLQSKYGPKAGLGGLFMEQSDVEREQAQAISERLPKMSLSELQSLSQSGTLAPVAPAQAKPLSAQPPMVKDNVQAAADAAAPVNKSSSFSSKLGDLDWTNITDNSSAYEKLKQEVKSPQALIDERAGLIGIDPNRAANDARLKAMEEKTGKAEEAAPWMALAQFGLGIAGARKGQEGEAISKSGINALQGLSAAKDKVEAAREKQFDLSTRQAQADRAEKVAAADYGIRSKEHREAQNNAAELAKIGYKTDLEVRNATGMYDAKKAKVAAQLDLKKLDQAAAQHSQTIAMYEKRMKSADAATAAKLIATKQSVMKNMQSDPAYTDAYLALKKKYNNDVGNELFKGELKLLREGYIANALGQVLEADEGVRTAESLGGGTYGAAD